MAIPTELYHYTGNPTSLNEYIKYPSFLEAKPVGLWFSIEDFDDDETWYKWCLAEEFRLDSLKYKYSVKFKDTAKILYLRTAEEIIEFSDKYKKEYLLDSCIYSLHWDKLREEYDCIMIAPYQWKCRHSIPQTTWYYGWDCASGCVWNLESVESLDLVSITEEIPKDSHTEIAQ